MNNADTEFLLVLYWALTPVVAWIEQRPPSKTGPNNNNNDAFLVLLRRSLLMILRYIEKQHSAAALDQMRHEIQNLTRATPGLPGSQPLH